MRYRLTKGVGCLLASTVATLALASPGIAVPSGEQAKAYVWGYIKNVHSGLCLEIRGDSTADGATANQWECNGSDTQLWRLEGVTGSEFSFTFHNKNSGKCLEIRGDSKADGATANQWTCNGSATQQWEIQLKSNPVVWNGNSNKCLEILSWGTGNGDLAGQWRCHGGNNQRWNFPAV
ncbi:RICIN domain-containing protein [Streptomyces roseoverticillatus]|uniref:RICIN domain-containing protein n=1 Tax=Streptomyces roseoverticillatus TaxID=66429 RepID=A0ABV3J642_9ACTN